MTIEQSLQQFYKKNNFNDDGGENDDFFDLKFKFFTIKLPNPAFRKKVIHIHDIEHVLHNCDTSWKGEAFIAGWEVATGFWKYLPIGIISLWAMGFSLLVFPKEVLRGFKAGINSKGIVDLKMSKKELLQIPVSELKKNLKKEKVKKINWFSFLFWCFISEVILFSPLLILIGIVIWIF
jgi:hypothetical protein